eukprot:CAMPEP_0180530546 /NCGR_PEP_ID=MMETSP1036_2-20121128/61998_1 /TAXON_ID=632150 /ORGANISM="Azadinium spinosum, Strain 3D9" /LENGTH=70 /DNA_ID=CAMNT_0022544397 /DNA_START=378 /DNA_END=590 /DNA_ORIENTATION=+
MGHGGIVQRWHAQEVTAIAEPLRNRVISASRNGPGSAPRSAMLCYDLAMPSFEGFQPPLAPIDEGEMPCI